MVYKFESRDVHIAYDLLPESSYLLRIVKAEERQTKNGDLAIFFDYVIDSGSQEGRHVFDTFLPEHPTAGNVSKSNMKRLVDACEVEGWDDAGEMVGKQFVGKLVHREQKDGQIREKIMSYKKVPSYAITTTNKFKQADDIAF